MKNFIQLNLYYSVELLSRFELAGCNDLQHFGIWKKMSTINHFNTIIKNIAVVKYSDLKVNVNFYFYIDLFT